MTRKYMLTPENRSSPDKGFTLLELLVSIGLLSIILSLLFNSFFQIATSTKKVTQSLESGQELRLLMKIILDDLQSVQYLKNLVANQDATTGKYYHSGILSKRVAGPDSQRVNFIHFHAAIPTRFYPEAIDRNIDPELHEVSYSLEFDDLDQKWVFMRREDFYIDDDISTGGKEQILTDSIVGFELEFLKNITRSANSSELQSNWVPEWDSQEGRCSPSPSSQDPCLPLAIRLTLSLQKENEEKISDTLEINLPTQLLL